MSALRKTLNDDQFVTAPLVFNPVMAKLAERAGLPALFLGGGSLGYVKTILEANLNVTEMCRAALGIRILLDPSNPFIAAYRAWKQCYEFMVTGMDNPGFSAKDAEEITKDMFDTIGLEKLLDAEQRTYDKP